VISLEQIESLGGYPVIYADPAWPYRNRGGNGAAENHYPVMTVPEIKVLPVARLAAKDALLFMWGTWPNLPEALEVIHAWGFDYKTLAFLWVKTRGEKLHFGTGRYTRANTEGCFLGVRGRGIDLVQNHAVRQVFAEEGEPETLLAPVGRHSAKPLEIRNRIVELTGSDVPKIELFARAGAIGWDAWGNESGVDPDLQIDLRVA
jgi:N6-adenosine-specific RNA methylase IME4